MATEKIMKKYLTCPKLFALVPAHKVSEKGENLHLMEVIYNRSTREVEATKGTTECGPRKLKKEESLAIKNIFRINRSLERGIDDEEYLNALRIELTNKQNQGTKICGQCVATLFADPNPLEDEQDK